MNIRLIEEKDFEEDVLNNQGVVCVKFYASWCGPCRMLSNVMEDMQDAKYDSIKVVEINVDNAQRLSSRLGIMSVPTMLFYDHGALVESVVGFRNATQLSELFDKYVK